jgi:hypothetical protein
MHQIFLNNPKFYGSFRAGLARVGDNYEKAKILFRLSGELSPVVVEAIFSSDVPKNFWMLNAPIYRRIEGFLSTREPLFACRTNKLNKPINCLIIQANASGLVQGVRKADGRELVLGELKAAANECLEVEKQLLAYKSKHGGIGRVLLFTKKVVRGQRFVDDILDVLRDETWDLIHFVGHSYYDRAKHEGYIFFPNPQAGAPPEMVNIENFSVRLVSTSFLFLSSCQSAEEGFLVPLARCKIPAAIGFRWQVDDVDAKEYATIFYQQLFSEEQKCITHAFQRTQGLIHDDPNYASKRIWAAPVLMMQ